MQRHRKSSTQSNKLAITPAPHGFGRLAEAGLRHLSHLYPPLVRSQERARSMANEPLDMMSREIDEELRREQLLKLWDKYGVYVLGLVLAVVVGIAGWKYYQHQRTEANQAASNQFIYALNDLGSKRVIEGQKGLEALAASAPKGYAALARLRLASQQGADGSILDALKTYESLANDETVDPILRDFARLQIGMLKFDTMFFSDLRNQINSLTSDRSPWRHSARELLGMGAMKAGLGPEARSHFKRLLADSATPPGIAERARMMVAMLDEAERAKSAPDALTGCTRRRTKAGNAVQG
jgi:hypothetical protein